MAVRTFYCKFACLFYDAVYKLIKVTSVGQLISPASTNGVLRLVRILVLHNNGALYALYSKVFLQTCTILVKIMYCLNIRSGC